MKKNRIRICGRNTSTLPAPRDHAVDQQARERPSRQVRGGELAERRHAAVDPVHGRFRPAEHRLEHHEQHRDQHQRARPPDAAARASMRAIQRLSARRGCNPRPRAVRADRVCVCSASSARGLLPRRRGDDAMAFQCAGSMASMSASAPPRFTATVGSTGTPSSAASRATSICTPRRRRHPCG